jgi:hypothetical protein
MSTTFTIIVAAIYTFALATILVFLAGAARGNERWDRSNRKLWERTRRFQSGWEEEKAA